MRKILPAILVGISLLLVWSCGNPSLFVPEIQNASPVTITTITSGSLLSQSESIPVQLAYSNGFKTDGKSADSMEIHLYDSNQQEVGKYVLGPDQLAAQDQFTIDLPDLPDGLYTLIITVYGDGKQLDQQTSQFFHVSGTYAINAISVYPSSLFPGSDGLLKAHIESPEGADPYLRWTMNGTVVAEGPLSAGTDQVTVRAPEVEGAYNVVLELFPFSPVGGASFSFNSSIKQNTELYVSRSQQLGDNDLSPEDSYYSLFHFRGDMRDSGIRSQPGAVVRSASSPPPAVPIGSPGLQVDGTIFGYGFDGTDGVRVSEVLLPFTGTVLSPFSLSIRGMATSLGGDRNLFSASSTDGTFAFALSVDGTGAVHARIASGGTTATAGSGVPVFESGAAELFSVSVQPGTTTTRIAWYKNGTYLSETDLPLGFPAPSSGAQLNAVSGSTTIAGSSGFVGIIDELGVYFRDPSDRPATDNQLFSRAMAQEYGHSVVYAEGFEGVSVPDGLTTEGSVSVHNGMLSLAPGSSVLFPKFLFEQDTLAVELSLDQDAAKQAGSVTFSLVSAAASGSTTPGSISGSSGAGTSVSSNAPSAPGQPTTQLFRLDTAGNVGVPRSLMVALQRNGANVPLSRLSVGADGWYTFQLSNPPTQSLQPELIHNGPDMAVRIGQDQFALNFGDVDFAGVRMTLSQSSHTTLPFRVQSVLARTEGAGLADMLRSLVGAAGTAGTDGSTSQASSRTSSDSAPKSR